MAPNLHTSAFLGCGSRSFSQRVAAPLQGRCSLVVVAQKKVKKTTKVVLKDQINGLGKKGDLRDVPLGFWRNFLAPRSKAVLATDDILKAIEEEARRERAEAKKLKTQAQAMATALTTIGKFVIRKKAGEENRIFGSVQNSEVVDAIYQQTGKQLDAKLVTLPEIKTLGTYDATIKLQPDVTGSFKVVVMKAKQA